MVNTCPPTSPPHTHTRCRHCYLQGGSANRVLNRSKSSQKAAGRGRSQGLSSTSLWTWGGWGGDSRSCCPDLCWYCLPLTAHYSAKQRLLQQLFIHLMFSFSFFFFLTEKKWGNDFKAGGEEWRRGAQMMSEAFIIFPICKKKIIIIQFFKIPAASASSTRAQTGANSLLLLFFFFLALNDYNTISRQTSPCQ